MDKMRYALCGVLVALCACSQERQDADVSSESGDEAVAVPAYRAGVAAVEFDDDFLEMVGDDLAGGSVVTKSSSLNSALAELGIESVRREFPDAGEYEPLHRKYGLHRWYVVKYSEDTPATKASEELSAVEGVLRVVSKPRIELRGFDDQYLSVQWGLYNDGSFSRGAQKGFDIGMMKVWNDGTFATGDASVIVSVVDGGIDYEHEDLAANVIPGGEDGSWNFVDSSATIVPHDHGTHVAGIIAAVGDNGKGVAGIAGGDAAAGVSGISLLNCQIFRTDKITGEDISSDDDAAAIVWGADHGAVISQNSWGFTADTDDDGKISSVERAAWYSYTMDDFPDLKAAIDYFVDNAGYDSGGKEGGRQVGPMAGGLVMFAAGNDALGYDPIGHYSNVIAVGAVDCDGSQSYYSNHDDDYGSYGEWVDICAPGTDVASTVTDGNYAYMSGTSMACPHVSGVAALVVANRGGEGFTNAMLREMLIGGANEDAMSEGGVGPMLDAYAALTYGITDVPSKVSSFSAEVDENSIVCTWAAVSGEKHLAYDYVLLASKDEGTLAEADPSSPASGIVSKPFSAGSTTEAGDKLSDAIDGLDYDTTYYVAVAAADASGHFSELSDILSVKTEANEPPVITIDESPVTLRAHETAGVSFTVEDKHGDAFEVSLEAGSAAASVASYGGGSYKLVIDAPLASAGEYVTVITATDCYGGSSSASVPYVILENNAPQLTGDFANILLTKGGNATISPAGNFADADGETLTYSMSVSDATVLSFQSAGSGFIINGKGYGVADVAVTAKDALGAEAEASFKVLVRDAGVDAEVYPNPVSETLYVRTGLEEAQTHVKMVSSTGAVVYEESAMSGAFSPMSMDVRSMAPGLYRVWVSYGSVEEDFVIVKI